jgi:hypothetical protein
MSSINPNNIDGTYPIAGQDNDSQGFRDNFTNIKNNFTFASTEITDLQNNAILKSALSGTTLDNNINNAVLKGAQILKFTETWNDLGPLSGNVTVNWNEGHFQTIETSGNIALGFDQWPTSGYWTSFKLQITPTNTVHTLTLPSEVANNLANVQMSNGQILSFPYANVPYLFEFSTYDGGTNVTIRDLLRNYDIDSGSSTFSTANITANTAATTTTTGALKVGGGVGIAGNVVAGNVNATIGTYTNVVASTGVRITSSTGKLGYNAGGNVTQATNKYTGVTLNSATGTITMVNTAMANGNVATFTLTNSVVESDDYILVQHQSVGTLGAYTCTASPSSGTTQIHVTNISQAVGALSEAIVLRYAVIKSANS